MKNSDLLEVKLVQDVEKWREEFEDGELFKKAGCDSYSDPINPYDAYVEGRKAAQAEIDALKEQLKREMECVDFYANEQSWTGRVQSHRAFRNRIANEDVGESEILIHRKVPVGGKRARQTQAQRKVEI